jgi:ATP-dependent RNA helicase SUPV3L1/SUV3
MVEGHRVGHLAGFRFQADLTAEGQDAKAVRNAAAKALANEIETRAERFSNAANKDIIHSIDGTVRWIGEPVAKLVGGEDALKPQVAILADEQLTGPARDKVQARLDLWIKAQIDTLLKPLIDLRDAADLEGMARGLAFQIVEKLGTIERAQVSDDVKALDQTMRAGLRKYGVRFGAYHIFVPALLKPAPSALIALLWALKNNQMDAAGRAELAMMSASGRTSIKTDPTFAGPLYKIFGFRVCGERAVRLDILERLADIIRPLIAWKPIEPGVTPPPGAIAQGGGFTVTLAMTSLLGANSEDMHMILKSLGYRVEKRTVPKPRPVETAAPAPMAAPESETVTEATEAAEPTDETLSVVAAETPATVSASEPMATDDAPTVEASAEAPTEALAEPADTAEAPVTAEPEMIEIEVWRPGRFERRDNQGPRREQRPQGDRPPRSDRPHADRPRGDRPQGDRPQGDRPQGDRGPRRDGAPSGAPGGGRVDRGSSHGQQRFERRFDRRPDQGGPPAGGSGRPDNRPPRPDRGPQPAQNDRAKRPEKPIDPDSPFAKLMALKTELEQKGKK